MMKLMTITGNKAETGRYARQLKTRIIEGSAYDLIKNIMRIMIDLLQTIQRVFVLYLKLFGPTKAELQAKEIG